MCFRQLALKTVDAQAASYSITALGTDGASNMDCIFAATIKGGSFENNEVFSLPEKNVRLLTAVEGRYEKHNGDVFSCK